MRRRRPKVLVRRISVLDGKRGSGPGLHVVTTVYNNRFVCVQDGELLSYDFLHTGRNQMESLSRS